MYLALYRKWRPKLFSDVVSQEHITTILQNQVRSGKTAHAYLFTGSRGTGKTTCSKILAKAVNCLHPVDGNPCLECSVCKGIEDGSILDITEMDAASNNGVDDIRVLRDEANFAPTVCKYRVYIIDEVHMLSVSAFNALLKIMEEPPPHVIFILATTELHKVPATIVSRCQQYDFRRIRPADIEARLSFVAGQEGINLHPDAASLIARLADGGMRDALSLLDQCIAVSDDITDQVVADTAGVAGREHLFALSDAILKQDTATALTIVNELYENAKGIDRITAELTSHFRDILLCRSVSEPKKLIVALPDELERMTAMAQSVALDRILAILRELQRCTDALTRSADKRVELEMTMIRLCDPPASSTAAPTAAPASSANAALVQRISQLEKLVAQLSQFPSGNDVSRSQPVPAAVPQQMSVANHDTSSAMQQPAVSAQQSPQPAPQQPKPQTISAPAADNAGESAVPSSGANEPPAEPLPQWEELLREMETSDPALFSMLDGSTATRSGKTVIISSTNQMLKGMLMTNNIGARLADLVEQKLGSRHKLRIAKKAPVAAAQKQSPAFADILSRAAGEGVEIRLQK